MKQSIYNISLNLEKGKTILFNAFTKKFTIISSKYYDGYRKLLANPDKYMEMPQLKSVIDSFIANGFVIDNRQDEIAFLASAFQERRREPYYSLLIMTTYACNFKCWYCVQQHKNMPLDTTTEERIKKHIVLYLLENQINKFEISWFGGEPLLNYSSIERVSEYAMRFCKQHHIKFNCSITTNGSLLTKEVVLSMKRLNFDNFQITIDGDKYSHNLTKKNEEIIDSFSLILNNIALIAQTIPEASITVRINYTHQNISAEFPEQVDEFLHQFKDRITILFRQVWQEQDSITLDTIICASMIQFKKMGYFVEHDFNNYTLLSCYVEKDHYLSVFPNGVVDKCSNKVIEEARGFIDDNGKIVWNSGQLNRKYNIFESNSECRNCKYLPICMGPCPAAREMDLVDEIKCNVTDKDNYFKSKILQYCSLIRSSILK